jgi:outer membrane biosynthesis protein TonB
MPQTLTPFNSLLMTIVLFTLAIGLPFLLVLAIRFLWDRHLYLGRSKELEKLIWQLHRIASAMEHQMNLSFPTVQPGTEEPSDLAYLKQPAAPAKAPAQPVAESVVIPSAAPSTAKEPAEQQPASSEQPAQQSPFPPLVPRDPSDDLPRRAGVNSMFGL